MSLPKSIIVILGPTASGKSNLAVKLAKKVNGEIISADSRQVYKGMDIGTGKVPRDKSKIKNQKSKIHIKNKKDYFHQGIKHHLLDVASPKRIFTVVQYRKLAIETINKIFKKGKVPILCGGTGFYVQALIDGFSIPKVKPDWKLRKKLDKKTAEELFEKLKKLDPKRAKTIDSKNKRRLVRALEILIKTKKPVPILKKEILPYPILLIGIKKSFRELKKLIKKRLLKRFRQGMISEIKKLRKSGISWKRLEEFGLEYRYIARYLQTLQNFSKKNLRGQEKLIKKEMIEKLQKEIEHFAKRQMTWFTRQSFAKQNLGGFKYDRRIHWIKNYKTSEKLVKKFLRK